MSIALPGGCKDALDILAYGFLGFFQSARDGRHGAGPRAIRPVLEIDKALKPFPELSKCFYFVLHGELLSLEHSFEVLHDGLNNSILASKIVIELALPRM